MEFLRVLEGIRTPILDTIFQFFTFFGEEMLVLAIVCIFYWCLNKKLAYQIGLTFFLSGLLLQSLKITFRIPRPWVLDPTFEAVPSAIPAATGYSFPSGHTMGATSLFTTMALTAKKKAFKIICIFLFLIVGFSRMYLGVHTPKDVIVAMGMSVIIALILQKVMALIQNTQKSNAVIGVILAVLSTLAIIYSLVLLSSGTIDAPYAADCCKAAGAGLGFALGWFLERTYINFDTQAPMPKQILKLIVGLVITVLLKIILKAILGSDILAEIVQYFVLVLWILAIYPFLLVRFKLCGTVSKSK